MTRRRWSDCVFVSGLSQVTGLYVAWTGKITAANIQLPLPNVVPYVLQTMGTVTVAYVGVLSAADQSAMDPSIVATLNVTASDVQSLVDARDAAALAGANFFVALISGRVNTPAEVDAIVAPFASKFDVIAFGLAQNTAFQRTVNGTLVVSSLDSGLGYARITVPGKVVTFVGPIANSAPKDPRGSLELTVWTQLSTCKGSTKAVSVNYKLLGRSVSLSTNTLRYCRISENPVNVIQLESLRFVTKATLAVINTGATRDDLPSLFVPDTGLELRRSGVKGPFDIVSGDADSISPFGNVIYMQQVSSSELCAIARWAFCSDANPIVTRQIMGQMLGFKASGIIYANLTCAVTSVTFADGTPVDCSVTTDRYSMAMSSFLVGGGDGFPIIPRQAQLFNVTDRDVLLAYLLNIGSQAGGSSLPLDTFLPFDMRITRRERICSRNYVVEVQRGWSVSVTNAALSELPFPNTSNACVELELTGLSPRDFSQRGTSLTSVSTVLAPPNDYAVVTRNDGLVVGQLAGYPINVTIYSTDPAVDGATIVVRVCVPEAQFVQPFFGPFKFPSLSVSRRGGPFFVFTTAITYNDTDSGLWPTYCGDVSVRINEPTVVAPARSVSVASASTFNDAEKAFLFIFGIIYLAFTCYAAVLLAHHIVLTRAQEGDWKDFVNPAMVVRLELILIGLCRFLYFVLLPWGTFSINVLGGYFLFEFPFILDFSVYSTFLQLFVTVFHWRKLRTIEKRYLWVPLLIVNVLLFAFFFTVLIVYGVSTNPNVQQAIVLAYRITLASLAFLVVIAFAVYGTILLRRVRTAVKNGNAPSWLPQMKRLLVVTALATCGILAIFIVIIYTAVQSVPDPVLSSTPWVICFLFLAELLPLLAILHDLHRTALVNQSNFLSATSSKADPSSTPAASSSTPSGPFSKRRTTLSFKVSARSKNTEDEGGVHKKSARIDSANAPSGTMSPMSGEVVDIDSAFAEAEDDPNAENLDEGFKRTSVVL